MKRITLLLVPLIAVSVGCTSNLGKTLNATTPAAIVDVYFDNVFLGSLGLVEGVDTEKGYEEFITVLDERIGLGIEITASDIEIHDTFAGGKLKVNQRWIDPALQDPERPYPEFPVFSGRGVTVHGLRFDSSLHIRSTDDGKAMSGYNLDTDDGWRLVLRRP